MREGPVLITPSDAAHVLGLPLGTLRRWVHEGRVARHPVTKHGQVRRYLVDYTQVLALVEARAGDARACRTGLRTGQ